MLASFSEFDGSNGFFHFGLLRAEELLGMQPENLLDVSPDAALEYQRSGFEGQGAHLANYPKSSGSGHTHAPKSSNECANAQKRFRARQKERLTCLEREVAEKKATFEQLAQENLVLRARTNILEKVLSCRDEQLDMVQRFEERCRYGPPGSSCFGSSSSNTTLKGNDVSHHSFRTMTKEQVIPQYKAFLSEVSRYLLHCQHPCNDHTSVVVQQVTTCVERMGYVLKHLLLLNSQLMRQLLLLNLETLQLGSALDSHWDGVVTSLQLGAQQRADILSVLGLYHRLLEKVYDERKLIRRALGDGWSTLSPSCPSFSTGRNDLASEMELTERLNANLAKEHSAHTLLSCFFFGKVLAPPQFAKMAVYSYPYFPDCLAVALAVARLPGQALGTGSGIHAFQGVAEEAGR